MSLGPILDRAGTWSGRSTLQDPENGIAQHSESGATITPVLQGRFARLDYTWSYRGKPQEGSILIGHDPNADLYTGHWIDSWHMGYALMACTGALSGTTLSLVGSYAAPPGPDWSWRIEIGGREQELRITMFNIWPEGREELAVEAVYATGGLSRGDEV